MTYEKKLWLQFLDTVRNTVSESDGSPFAAVVALYLARSSQNISNPEHELYSKLNKSLLSRPAVGTKNLPEFLRMLHSYESGYK
jgi:hypothetical protein